MNVNSLDKFRLNNKVAVVTGAHGNIGPFWTKALLEAGAKVAALDLPKIKVCREQKKLLKRYTEKKLLFLSADVTNKESLKKTRKKIIKKFRKIDIIVNNAGIDTPPVKLAKNKNKESDFSRLNQKIWQVNVCGIVNCIEVFGQNLIEQKSGSIINIGSLYADVSPDHRLYSHLNFDKAWSYGATKGAVLQVTKYFATRLAKYNVRVNSLSPGGILANQDKKFIKKYSDRVPMGRMANVNDLGGPLLFLASNASSYVTATNLEVNGGFAAW